MRLLLLVLAVFVTTPVLSQDTQPKKAFSVGVQGLDPAISKKLSEQEILKDVKFKFKRTEQTVTFTLCKGATCESDSESTRTALTDLVNLAITQQNRLAFISNTVRRVSDNSGSLSLDFILSLLKQTYPEVDFNDPQVLKTFRKTAKGLSGSFGGMLTEPTGIAVFALIEPELAIRGRIVALESQLKRQGDSERIARTQQQIDELKLVLGEGLKGDVSDQQEKLVAMQKALKDQGVPVPSSAVGAKVLVDQLYERFQEITKGKSLPTPVDLSVIDRAGVVNKFFATLDERITQLENQPVP